MNKKNSPKQTNFFYLCLMISNSYQGSTKLPLKYTEIFASLALCNFQFTATSFIFISDYYILRLFLTQRSLIRRGFKNVPKHFNRKVNFQPLKIIFFFQNLELSLTPDRSAMTLCIIK